MPTASEYTFPTTSRFRLTETNLTGFVLTAANTSVSPGMRAVISLSPALSLELNSNEPVADSNFITLAGFSLVPMM